MSECRVDSAFGQSGCVSDRAHAGADVTPIISYGMAVKMQVNDERCRFLIVPDQVAHQHVQHVIVNGDGSFETRHRERMKKELRRKK